MTPQPRKVVVAMHDARPIWAITEEAVALIRAALPADAELVVVDDPIDGHGDGAGLSERALTAIRGAEIYCGIGFPRPLFDAAEAHAPGTLRWVHTGTAGVRSLLFPALREAPVILTNSAGVHAPAIAETVLGMMLHFARGLDYAVRAQAQRTWATGAFDRGDTAVRELSESTLGLVGLGGIGRALAARARPLGMRCVAVRRSPDADRPDGIEVLHGPDALPRLLALSHYVVLAAPATPATENLIGRAEIERLRADAVLINVGRGSLVDEPALVHALAAGRIRGAGLDVFATEPLPPASPLWSLPNVLITPHVSAVSALYWKREVRLIVENLGRYFAGQPLRNVVDKAAGY